jgi:hypothetical protein
MEYFYRAALGALFWVAAETETTEGNRRHGREP